MTSRTFMLKVPESFQDRTVLKPMIDLLNYTFIWCSDRY